MATLTTEQKQWRAQDDARALIESEAIKADGPRLNRALKETKAIATEAEKKATAAKKVAKKVKPKRSTKGKSKPKSKARTRKR